MPFTSRIVFVIENSAPHITASAPPKLCPVSQNVGCALVDNPSRLGVSGGRGVTLFTAPAIVSHECRTASVKPECTSPTSLAPSKNQENRAGAAFRFVIQSFRLAVPRKANTAYSSDPAANP